MEIAVRCDGLDVFQKLIVINEYLKSNFINDRKIWRDLQFR